MATTGALNESFDDTGQFISSVKGGRKLIILDEADNLYEKIEGGGQEGDFSDKGGKRAIIDTIKQTNQPIMLIVNDYYNLVKGSGDALKRLCSVIQFYTVNANQIIELLKGICREENIAVDLKVLKTIADRCGGDVRSAINDLQSLCVNRTQVDVESVDVLGYRDREKYIFDAVREVFKSRNVKNLSETIRNVDIHPKTFRRFY